jgi:hypothetical protein
MELPLMKDAPGRTGMSQKFKFMADGVGKISTTKSTKHTKKKEKKM